jgi:hypothetical protein
MTAGADQVTGNTGGIQKTDLGATEVIMDVTKWVGAYVKISAKGSTVFYVFSPLNTNVLSDVEALDAASPNAGAPDFVDSGSFTHELVPDLPSGATAMRLHVKAEASGTRVKVRRAQP